MADMDARREQMLAEMGIKPRWRLRDAEPVETAATQDDSVVAAQAEIAPMLSDHVHATSVDEPVASADVPTAADSDPAPTAAAVPSTGNFAALGWDELEKACTACRACRLCQARKQAVFGVGNREADWMIVGEGPGAEEDQRGEPFVGQAGRLLDAMLESIGLSRKTNVYIGNAVKCRPPGNRTPQPDEMSTCWPFLQRQIALVQPKVILAMGRPAAQTLLGGEPRISSARGKVFHYESIPVIVTYHPAYLLRNLPDKAKAWEDLCFAQDVMAKLS